MDHLKEVSVFALRSGSADEYKKSLRYPEMVHVQEWSFQSCVDSAELAVLPSQTEEDPALEPMEELGPT